MIPDHFKIQKIHLVLSKGITGWDPSALEQPVGSVVEKHDQFMF